MINRDMKEIILSRESVVVRLEKFVEEMLDYYNIPSEYFGNIVLANLLTAEMLMGSAGSQDQVRVFVRQEEQGLCFCHRLRTGIKPVKELDEIQLARAQNALNKDVFIIRSLTDAIQVKEKGRIIELRFTISGIELDRMLSRSTLVQNYFNRNPNSLTAHER